MTGERHAWARDAGYVLLRLPLEVGELFTEWLRAHFPGKLKHVQSLMRARKGKLYNDARMTGSGPYADWTQVRRGGCKTWTWAKPCAVALRFIPASGALGRTIALVLRGSASGVLR